MAIKLSEAKKMGDIKLRVIKSSAINEVLKGIMEKKQEAVSIPEFMAEIKKLPEYEKLFQTSDKALITNGKVNAAKLLKVRLNDMVYNSTKKKVAVERTFDKDGKYSDNGEKLHYWYINVKEDLGEAVAKSVKEAKK